MSWGRKGSVAEVTAAARERFVIAEEEVLLRIVVNILSCVCMEQRESCDYVKRERLYFPNPI